MNREPVTYSIFPYVGPSSFRTITTDGVPDVDVPPLRDDTHTVIGGFMGPLFYKDDRIFVKTPAYMGDTFDEIGAYAMDEG
jgi:hypothetical protein